MLHNQLIFQPVAFTLCDFYTIDYTFLASVSLLNTNQNLITRKTFSIIPDFSWYYILRGHLSAILCFLEDFLCSIVFIHFLLFITFLKNKDIYTLNKRTLA